MRRLLDERIEIRRENAVDLAGRHKTAKYLMSKTGSTLGDRIVDILSAMPGLCVEIPMTLHEPTIQCDRALSHVGLKTLHSEAFSKAVGQPSSLVFESPTPDQRCFHYAGAK